jgi:hypothetical protein
MRIPMLTTALILAASSQMGATGGGCEPPIIRDPGFDLWCGESLCTWKLVAGSIEKAPTWHSEDAGVAFIGSESSIEQTSPVDSGDGRCIKFDLVANVDDKAEMRLQADVYADGSIDLDERIPTSSWKPLTYNIRIDGAYRGIRFVLVKRGSGKATLAQIAATIADPAECDGFAAVPVAPAPIGARCDSDGDCESNLCRVVEDPSVFFGSAMTCVGCDPLAAACGGDEVCGIFEPSSFVRTIVPACVTAAGDETGERCRLDAECASGICNGGVCSECDGTRACTNGGSCRLAYEKGPTTCTAGAPGEPCAIDGDCTSGQCDGAERKQCDDGRGCNSPETCPVVDDGTLEPGACTLVGVLGGTCL